MKKDRVFLVHILESINLISKYLNGVDKETFLETIQLQDSVIIRRFEIISEAAKNISKSTRTKYAEVPWKLMAGMRDIFNTRILWCRFR